MTKLTIEIDETLWETEVENQNLLTAQQHEARSSQAKAQHERVMSQTPEKQRTDFVALDTPVELNVENLIVLTIAQAEAGLVAKEKAKHIALLAKQTPEVLSKLASQFK